MLNDESRQRPAYWLLFGVVSVLFAGLLLYSQTMAFAWDEGFHLLAAQLILGGKKPYLDFLLSQTPLNAYWNAGWMAVFGDTWRTGHAVAAVRTAGAILLAADFLFRRFPVLGWRPAAAIAVAAAIGMNAVVVDFGTIGQAYALCLFLIVAAFRLSVEALDRSNMLLPALAGLLAGAAASSSLLTAPVAPVLLLWMAVYNRAGNRWAKVAAFCLGVAIAFVPLLLLFLQSPR